METEAKKTIEAPQWLVDMPKTDLHCHLGGSMRIKTILELAEKNGVKLPVNSEAELRRLVVFKNRANKKLEDYLAGIKICESVLKKPEDFARVSYEICQDANSENVNIFELRMGPTNYISERLKLYEIIESTLAGLKKGAQDFNMHTGLIVCGIRTDLDATRKAAESAVNYQDQGVVGFDLAGRENGYRPKTFEDVIKPVLHNFLPVTIHAGEDDTVASIAEAVIYLDARRIGHAVTLRESTKLLGYIDKIRIGLELCLTSNIDTGAVASIQSHPARTYNESNLRISVNTDNRTISDTNVTNEYMLLINEAGFSQDDIYNVAKHGIKSAFLNSRKTREYLDIFDKSISQKK